VAELEFRVVWKRQGLSRKTKTYKRLATADRRRLLLSGSPDERFAALRIADPDESACCSGHECGCGGMTYREHDTEYIEGMPPLEYVVIEERTVGPWGAVLRCAKCEEPANG
jgi:hypothetical protein